MSLGRHTCYYGYVMVEYGFLGFCDRNLLSQSRAGGICVQVFKDGPLIYITIIFEHVFDVRVSGLSLRYWKLV